MVDARAKIVIGGALSAVYGIDMDFLAIRYEVALYRFSLEIRRRKRPGLSPCVHSSLLVLL